MHVLMLHNTGNLEVPSGERIVVDHETSALRRLGVQVTEELVDNEELRKVNWIGKLAVASEAYWSYPAARHVAQLIEECHPDVVHVHNVFPRLSMSIFAACRRCHVPVVHTLHNFRYLCVEGCFFRAGKQCLDCLTISNWSGVRHRCARGSLAASLLLTLSNRAHVHAKNLFQHVDRFLCVSQFVRDTYEARGFPANKLLVKYHGIPMLEGLEETAQAQEQTNFRVLFIGRLSAAKGTQLLKEIPPRLPDVEFRIIGSGPDQAGLADHYRQNRLQQVTMLGRLEPWEVEKELRAASCVLIPSLCPESFGLVAAEAMAHARPIVASKIGALAELIEKSGGGVAVPWDHGASPFVEALKRLQHDKELQRAWGAAGRQFARQHLTLDQSARYLKSVYESLLAPPVASNNPETADSVAS